MNIWTESEEQVQDLRHLPIATSSHAPSKIAALVSSAWLGVGNLGISAPVSAPRLRTPIPLRRSPPISTAATIAPATSAPSVTAGPPSAAPAASVGVAGLWPLALHYLSQNSGDEGHRDSYRPVGSYLLHFSTGRCYCHCWSDLSRFAKVHSYQCHRLCVHVQRITFTQDGIVNHTSERLTLFKLR